jgi:hypothetical protein
VEAKHVDLVCKPSEGRSEGVSIIDFFLFPLTLPGFAALYQRVMSWLTKQYAVCSLSHSFSQVNIRYFDK